MAGVRWIRKEVGDGALEMALNAFALDSDLAHSLKVAILFVVAARIVGELEQ